MLDGLVGSFGYGNFILVLSVLVFIHELGHYLVARWCGVRIEAFSVGFGKELFGWTDKRATRWKVCLIPLGGYVKMYGEANPTDDLEQVSRDAEQAIGESFTHKNVWQRMAIVAAGPAANFLLAIVGFAMIAALVGKPVQRDFLDYGIGSVQEGSAADEAGFRSGDLILSINGEAIEDFSQLVTLVQNSNGSPLAIEIDRNASRQIIVVSPRPVEIGSGDDARTVYRMGITGPGIDYEKSDPVSAIGSGFTQTWDISMQTLGAIGEMITGDRGTEELGGPVRIAQMSNEFAQAGFLPLLFLTLMLSVNLGLLNLLPIPVLDGGHLLFYTVEAIIGKPVPLKIQEVGLKFGLVMLIGLMVFATFNDIVNF